MKINFSRRFATLAVVVLSFLPLTIQAQQLLVVGRDYTAIEPPVAAQSPAKLEVIEFFSYACSHCNELNPSLVTWVGKLPKDVQFRRVAVSFNPFYRLMARFYYTLEAMGEENRLDVKVFDALHNKGIKLINEKSIRDWVVDQGVDAKKFNDVFKSAKIDEKLKEADRLAGLVGLKGVPSLAVDGRYLVAGDLALVDKVILKARFARSQPKP